MEMLRPGSRCVKGSGISRVFILLSAILWLPPDSHFEARLECALVKPRAGGADGEHGRRVQVQVRAAIAGRTVCHEEIEDEVLLVISFLVTDG